MINVNKREKCVSCGELLIEDHVIIGNQYPSAVYPKKGHQYRNDLEPSSLNLTKCPNTECGLVQLSNEYDLDYVFKNYPYETASTATMLDKLKDIVSDTEALVDLKESDTVLDIGGNDGSMLNLMNNKVKKRVNFDAASGIKSVISEKDYVRIEGLFDSNKYKSYSFDNPKLIYSVAMFYHLNDPIKFCRDVKSIMNDDTVWCIQMTYLGTMLKDNIYDNIVHEHVTYFSLQSLTYLLESLDLIIIKSKVVSSYGGSLRVHIMKKQNSIKPKASTVKAYEKENRINSLTSILAFNERAQVIKETIKNIVNHVVNKSGKLVALGASTKGNMICQFSDLDSSKIKYILDNNDKKIGSITTGTDIPIIDEGDGLNNLPEYMLILPYYYTDFFIKLIKGKLNKGKHIDFIIPLPIPHFVRVESNN
jgi:hypothetical protein